MLWSGPKIACMCCMYFYDQDLIVAFWTWFDSSLLRLILLHVYAGCQGARCVLSSLQNNAVVLPCLYQENVGTQLQALKGFLFSTGLILHTSTVPIIFWMDYFHSSFKHMWLKLRDTHMQAHPACSVFIEFSKIKTSWDKPHPELKSKMIREALIVY